MNNASAISLTGTLATEMKRYDLMHQVNARRTFLVSKACLPHLLKAANPHVLMMSPPLDMSPRWFAPHVAYTMAKFGMSMCVLGMAEEFRGKVAFNALWPRTAISTSAVEFALGGPEALKMCRKPQILADAAHMIFEQPAASFTGNSSIDDSFLYEHGVRDFEPYRVDPTSPWPPDFFVRRELGPAAGGVRLPRRDGQAGKEERANKAKTALRRAVPDTPRRRSGRGGAGRRRRGRRPSSPRPPGAARRPTQGRGGPWCGCRPDGRASSREWRGVRIEEVGLSAARATTGWPVEMPPSTPPALLDDEHRPVVAHAPSRRRSPRRSGRRRRSRPRSRRP